MAQIMVIQAQSASEWVFGHAPEPTRLRFELVYVSKNPPQRCPLELDDPHIELIVRGEQSDPSSSREWMVVRLDGLA